jgi:hypothetical protein
MNSFSTTQNKMGHIHMQQQRSKKNHQVFQGTEIKKKDFRTQNQTFMLLILILIV